MITKGFQWLVFVVSVLYVLLYFKGGTVAVKDARRASKTKVGATYSKLLYFMSLCTAIILPTEALVCLGIIGTPLAKTAPWLIICGALLLIAGIGSVCQIRFCRLKNDWSCAVEVRKDHKIQDQGIYRYIRHPIYMASILVFIGSALVFPVWWYTVASAGMIAAYVALTLMEDNYLTENLPGYKEYSVRTPYRIFPGIW